MGKFKSFFIIAGALSVPILCFTSKDAAGIFQKAAYISAGAFIPNYTPAQTPDQSDSASYSAESESSNNIYPPLLQTENNFPPRNANSLNDSEESYPSASDDLSSSAASSSLSISSTLSGLNSSSISNSQISFENSYDESIKNTEPLGSMNTYSSDTAPSSLEELSSEQCINQSEQQSTETDIQTPERRIGKIITKNLTGSEDDTDYSIFTNYTADIERYTFEKSDADNYITLASGAQIRNCTDEKNETLIEESDQLPTFGDLENIDTEPQVLIYHTHTTESYLPYGDKFDEEYPLRSRDPERNVTAVGNAICSALSEQGIASIHDCKVHDYPQYTGAYYRSADTILEDMEEYPSVKIVIDIHRDGIFEEDGSATAPSIQINGKSAAQFMIITGCDNGEFDMPDYMENFKLACLLQNTAEKLYPNLARSVLFDYRNYNQSLSPNILLIEVGSHGNSLEEAVYTGELLGKIIANAINS